MTVGPSEQTLNTIVLTVGCGSPCLKQLQLKQIEQTQTGLFCRNVSKNNSCLGNCDPRLHSLLSRAQKKTTSVSLTIGSSSPKSGVTTAVIQPLSVPVQQVSLIHSPRGVRLFSVKTPSSPPLKYLLSGHTAGRKDNDKFFLLMH